MGLEDEFPFGARRIFRSHVSSRERKSRCRVFSECVSQESVKVVRFDLIESAMSC